MDGFAERLKELREEKNLSQVEFAKIIGVTHSAVSLWELKKRVPAFDVAVVIARFFNVSLEYLAGMED